ncbi:MAG: hypothetical protein AAF978_10130, partial [Cyanobacteria bacterium P01_E01_bin.48]
TADPDNPPPAIKISQVVMSTELRSGWAATGDKVTGTDESPIAPLRAKAESDRRALPISTPQAESSHQAYQQLFRETLPRNASFLACLTIVNGRSSCFYTSGAAPILLKST